MEMVGCTPDNAPRIEAGYERLLDILAPHVVGARYLFGSRPSLADFALYGQLAQLTIDPQPQRICRERAPVVESWAITLDDASGIDGEWQPEKAAGVREALLEMIGAVYLPSLTANAERSEEHTSEFQSLMRTSYAVLCLRKKNTPIILCVSADNYKL